jgi:hypothetical protein
MILRLGRPNGKVSEMSKWSLALVKSTLALSLVSGALVGSVSAQTTGPVGGTVAIESEITVERTAAEANGQNQVTWVKPNETKVVPGDSLLFTNLYRNTSGTAASGFVVNNPVHPAVSLTGITEAWALVSVDGGKNFAKLETLTVTETVDGVSSTRPAEYKDVTHIRWSFPNPIASGQSGKLSFRAVVK